jgi:asparagine synthetase B (glutamine-hydrolysing)
MKVRQKMANIFGTVDCVDYRNRGEAEKATAEMALAVSSSGTPQITTGQAGSSFSMGTTQEGGVVRSEDGTTHLVYSGQIFNKRDVAYRWGGEEDTGAFLLSGFSQGGINFLRELEGSFALAFYDERTRKLHLVGDPLGEKSLYVAHRSHGLHFASDLRELGAVHRLDKNADSAIGPHTVFDRVLKIEPGKVFEYNVFTGFPKITRLWQEEEDGGILSLRDPLQDLEESLNRSMLARIPPRPFALLWGGDLDSALLAAKMRPDLILACPVPGLERSERNAQAMADEIGVDYKKIGPEDAQLTTRPLSPIIGPDGPLKVDFLPEYWAYHYAASQRVRGMVSGLGVDELLLGYPRHMYFMSQMAGPLSSGSRIQALLAAARGEESPHTTYYNLIRRGRDHSGLARLVEAKFCLAKNFAQAVSLTDMAYSLPRDLAVSDLLADRFNLVTRYPFLAPDFVRACLNLPLPCKLDLRTCRTKIALEGPAEKAGVPRDIIYPDTAQDNSPSRTLSYA